jgi:hypothetical protein
VKRRAKQDESVLTSRQIDNIIKASRYEAEAVIFPSVW